MAIDLEELKALGNASPEDDLKDLILVHVTKDEVKYLNEMQHGEDLKEVDDGEGNLIPIPSYGQLYDKLSDPEVRKIFEEIATSTKSNEKQSAEMEGVSKFLKPFTPPVPGVKGLDTNSSVGNILKNMGEGSDDQLALFPKGLANYFDMVRGGTEINPNTDLRQYGVGKFFKKVIKFAAPIIGAIGGAMFGMPHIGATVGGAIGGGMGGGGWKGALKGGAIGGLGSLALSGLGGAIADKFPGAAGTLGLGGNGAVASGIRSSYLSPSLAAAGSATGNTALQQGTNAAISKGVANVAAPTFFQKMMEPSVIAPMALGAGLLYKGHLQDQKNQKKLEQREEEERRQRGAFNRGALESHGITATLSNVNPIKRFSNPYTSDDEYGGRQKRHFMGNLNYYAKGGKVAADQPLANMKEIQPAKVSQAIVGPGKGQEDRIPASLKKDDYIQDAHTVSMAGDGSTKAGHDHYKRLENLILRSEHKLKKGGLTVEDKKNNVDIPAALSDGERRTDYKVVRLLGGGSADKGAKIFDQLRKSLRIHKTSKGDKLPPKAYELEHYLPKNIRTKLVGA